MISVLNTGLSFDPLSPRRSTKRIIVHHSASPDVSAATIHGWHITQGWSGIGYHFVIRQNGNIEAGRPVDVIGAHSGPQGNGDSVGICLAGNFMESTPTDQQLQSLVQLVAYLRELYKSSLEVMRHKDVAATACPCDLFPWPENNWPLNGLSYNDNEGGNTVEPWKNELIAQALDKKLISEEYAPDKPAPTWFVLAVAINLLREVESGGEKQ
jgi:N-acetyl-anhydromuramyl-L-alanine amidase AmpD